VYEIFRLQDGGFYRILLKTCYESV